MSIELVKTLEVDDVIYECEYGTNIEVRIVTKPERSDTGQWTWVGETKIGDSEVSTIDYLITEGYAHYGPKLYTEPQYL